MNPISGMFCGIAFAGVGLMSNQPIGLMLGTVIANISYTKSVATQQKKHTYSLQKSLEIQSNYHLEMENVITSMQLEIQTITVQTEQLADSETSVDKKIVKLQNQSKKVSDKTAQVNHKLQTVHTSNRLLLSEVKQLQQQLKVKSALITGQQQQLDQLSIKVNHPVIETKPDQKIIPLPTITTNPGLAYLVC